MDIFNNNKYLRTRPFYNCKIAQVFNTSDFVCLGTISFLLFFSINYTFAQASGSNQIDAQLDGIELNISAGQIDSARILLNDLLQNSYSESTDLQKSRYHFLLGRQGYQEDLGLDIINDYDKALSFFKSAKVTDHEYQMRLYRAKGNAYHVYAQFDQAAEVFDQAIVYGEEHIGDNAYLVYDTYTSKARALINGPSRFSMVDSILQIALKRIEKSDEMDHMNAIYTHFVNGANHHFSFKYDDAIGHLEKVLDICERARDTTNTHMRAAMYKLGDLHRFKGDDEAALQYYNKHNALFGPGELYNSDLYKTFQHIAQLYAKQQKYDLALDYLDQAEFGFQNYVGTKAGFLAQVYQRKAGVYNELGEHDLAEEMYQSAFTQLESDDRGGTVLYAIIASDYGQYLIAQEDYEQGEELLSTSLNIWQVSYGQTNPHLASYYLNVADALIKTGQKERFDTTIYQAYTSIGYTPGSFDFSTLNAAPKLFRALQLEIQNLILANTEVSRDLIKLRIDETNELLEYLSETYQQDESKELLGYRSKALIDIVIKYAAEVYREGGDTTMLDVVYTLMQQGRDHILSGIYYSAGHGRGTISDRLVDINQQIRSLKQERVGTDDVLEKASIGARLFDLERSYDRQREASVAGDHSGLGNTKRVVLSRVSSYARSHQKSIIEYYWTDTDIYVLTMIYQSVQLDIIPLDKVLIESIDSLRSMVAE